jgi:CrcB protein
MMQVALVAMGGAAGSVLRYGMQKAGNTSFPAGTWLVNFVGCFLIGCLWAVSIRGLNEQLRLLLMTGFCGGFTTFSAFTLEGIQIIMSGRLALFFLYTISSVACGLLATFAGYKIFAQ